ncbi:MAG: choice-of-anchor I family protein [Crocosphaera sp.]|nr:choice-of-anchor I family protein [Crocosphaera sp.]
MSTIQLSPLGSYQTNIFADSAAEILAFDPLLQLLFVTNSANNTLDILDASAPEKLSLVSSIDLSIYGGGVNSVTVNDSLVAVAVEADAKEDPGTIVFFDFSDFDLDDLDEPEDLEESLTEIVDDAQLVEVGALPDMVTYTPDGSQVLVANEGESTDDFGSDPEGSISIIDVHTKATTTVDFNTFFDSKLNELGNEGFKDWFAEFEKRGFRSFGPTAVDAHGFIAGERFVDIEPEYIAVSADSSTAWATLQENNALAKIDLSTGTVEILPLGFKDHSLRGNELDASNRDGSINIQNWPVFGMYQPDTIEAYTATDGQTYLVMANEGDSRIRPDGGDNEGEIFNEESRIGDVILDPHAFPNAAELQLDENLGRLKITNTLGDTDGDGDFDELYAYGARSFSIRDGDGNLVFDSGADLERITAILNPDNFNSTDDENDSFDNRSDDKGPEPEGLTIGEVDGRTYAFVGLEREGGVLVYDITNPTDAEFVQYINPRNFNGNLEKTVANGTSGDVSPEGFVFISAANSPTGNPLLGIASEVSGSTTLYNISSEVTPPEGAIVGTDNSDILNGTATDDDIYGLGGDDIIYAQAGNDLVYAGQGNDQVKGNSGDDLILGQAGHDILKGGLGHDLIWGGLGNDLIRGGFHDDNLYGGEGDDTLQGGLGKDFLDGGIGDDTLKGGLQDDRLKGNLGDDVLQGQLGDDRLEGDQGHDTLKGGWDNDTLIGVDTEHNVSVDEVDVLIGGAGADKFVLGDQYKAYYDDSGLQDYAHIQDFNGTEGDVIQLFGFATDYTLGSAFSSTGIFLQTSEPDELIAVVDHLDLSTSLTSSFFEYH